MHFHSSIFSLASVSCLLTLVHANKYILPNQLFARQSSTYCPALYVTNPPSTWTQCGTGYITDQCTCCSNGYLACYSSFQTCQVDANGDSICCNKDSPNCGAGGASNSTANNCAAQGMVDCGGVGCVPSGYVCCAADPKHGSCPSDHTCCKNSDDTYGCCASDGSNSSSTATSTAGSTSTLATSTHSSTHSSSTGSGSTAAANSATSSGSKPTASNGASAKGLPHAGSAVAFILLQIGLGLFRW